MPVELPAAGAVLLFCTGAAKAEPARSVTTSAVASPSFFMLFPSLLKFVFSTYPEFHSDEGRGRENLEPSTRASSVSHATKGRNVCATRARRGAKGFSSEFRRVSHARAAPRCGVCARRFKT